MPIHLLDHYNLYMKNRGQKWTVEELSNLKYLYSQNYKISEISKIIERSESAIHKKLKEFDITPRLSKWTEDEIKKLKELFSKGLSYESISKEMNKSIRSCEAKAIRLGFKKKECNVWATNTRTDFWTNTEIEQLKKYSSYITDRKEIAAKLNRSEKAVNCKMTELGLYLKSKTNEQESNYRRFYTINDDYFEVINSQKKAYWIGWIITDGYVINRLNTQRGVTTSNRLGLKLQIDDIYVVEDFSKDLESTFPLRFQKARKGSLYKNKITGKEQLINAGSQCALEITSAKIVSDLKKYGIHQNKTYDTKFPENIDKRFYPGFIAGVISGDGSVNIKKNHNRGTFIRINIAGTLDLLSGIKKILVDNVNFNPDKLISKVRNSKRLYTLELNQTETYNLYKWFKSNNVELMKRKQEILEKYINENQYKFA